MTANSTTPNTDTSAGSTTRSATEQPVWTILVFMGAERVPGSADLVAASRADIEEMEELFVTKPRVPVNLFVQVHGDGEPYRRDIVNHERYDVSATDQDATNGNALIQFMRWAFDQAPDTDHSLLVLWGHAFEFAIGRAETRTGIDALDFAELAGVLETFQQRTARTLDIIGFDACDLATIEIAYQLRKYANYLLASEIGIPIPGWPYNRVLDRLKDPKDRQMGPAELGTYIVRRYCEAYRAEALTVSLTLLDLTKAEEVVGLTETLSRKLAISMADDPGELELISDLFVQSQTIEDKPFVDAADLCLNLFRNSSYGEVRTAAEKLGNFLISARPVPPGKSEYGEGRPFVVEHGRNACETGNLQGVSLYAPHVASIFDVEAAATFYEKLEFTKETLWDDVVRALAESG